ncbi:CPBP family glutamic-type intramembrane protease [bacterium]|nr:CPBP family glutamic-type intramembrane protease [bacterium]
MSEEVVHGEQAGDFWKLGRELVLLIGGTLFLSALVSPALYEVIGALFSEDPWPYSRVFDRVAMVVAAGMLWWRRKEYQLHRYRASFERFLTPPWVKPVIIGFFLSFCCSLAVLPLLVQGGTLVWSSHSSGEILWRFGKSIPAALLISLIEESFFRFFLFLSLRRYLPFLAAAALSSGLYAVVHFIQPVKSWGFSSLELTTGFQYLGLLLERFSYPGFLEAAFGLFLVGMVLCFTVERSRSLLPAIGLHAGWVTTTKVIGRLVGAAPGFEYPTGSGRRYYLLTDEFSWVAVILVGILSFILFRPRRDCSEQKP